MADGNILVCIPAYFLMCLIVGDDGEKKIPDEGKTKAQFCFWMLYGRLIQCTSTVLIYPGIYRMFCDL